MILIGTPVAVGYSIKAVKVASHRGTALVALVVSLLEALAVTLIVVLASVG
jgi:hypothetical protein